MMVLLGDVFGYVALVLVAFAAVFMALRRKILRHTRNLDLLRRLHFYAAALAGVFIVLHVAYFYAYPVTEAVAFGYASVALATLVWLTGTAFLERVRDSLFFHGAMSSCTVGLTVVHAAGAGTNIPSSLVYVVLAGVAVASAAMGARHLSRLEIPSKVKKT
jgi:hypothetical protein